MALPKVITVVGTRPEIIRLSRTIELFDKHTDHLLVHTGQNSDDELSANIFADLKLRDPDYSLGIDNVTPGQAIGQVIEQTERIFQTEKPHAVLILGDTNSSLSGIPAERMGIPVYHMEAGNRSFDREVPEEINRKIVDHLASFNLPYTEMARRNLLREGIHPRFIFKTGSPMPEVFEHYAKKISSSEVLERFGLDEKNFFVASAHRQENVDSPDRLAQLLDTLAGLAEEWSIPMVLSTHPRTLRRIRENNFDIPDQIISTQPLGFFDYIKLQKSSKCVISDSGTLPEEAMLGDFPAVSIRKSSERPEAMEEGLVLLSGLSREKLTACVKVATSQKVSMPKIDDYIAKGFSEKVLRIVLSTYHLHKEWRGLREDLYGK